MFFCNDNKYLQEQIKVDSTLLNIRVPSDLLEDFKVVVTDKNSNVSSELRAFMKREVELRNGVKTQQSKREQHSDFRDFLDGSTLHGNHGQAFQYKENDYVPKKRR